MRCCKIKKRNIRDEESMYRTKFLLLPRRLLVADGGPIKDNERAQGISTYETRWLERHRILYKRFWNKRRKKWGWWKPRAFVGYYLDNRK